MYRFRSDVQPESSKNRYPIKSSGVKFQQYSDLEGVESAIGMNFGLRTGGSGSIDPCQVRAYRSTFSTRDW